MVKSSMPNQQKKGGEKRGKEARERQSFGHYETTTKDLRN